MKAVMARLFMRFGRVGRERIELEVEEELRFHVELLAREYSRQGMSPEAARDASLRRFGNVERIRNQCVEISSRSRPFMRAIKSFLILAFLTGVVARLLSMDIYVGHIGKMLIAVAILGRMLLYARGLSPASFLSKTETSSPSVLNLASRTSIAAQRNRAGLAR